MTWSETVGDRLALILFADDTDAPPGGIVYGVVRPTGDGYVLDREDGKPSFPLLSDWAERVRCTSDIRDTEVLAIIGDAEWFLSVSAPTLSGDDIPADFIPTGFNWNEFNEDS